VAATKFMFALLLVAQVYGALFCFDDSTGHIDISYTTNFAFKSWGLVWTDGVWSKPANGGTAGSHTFVTASACCSGGTFRTKRLTNGVYSSPFEFIGETHVVCGPAVPWCFFRVVGTRYHQAQELIVSGRITCNCVPARIEVGDWEDFEFNTSRKFEANVTFVLEDESRVGKGFIN